MIVSFDIPGDGTTVAAEIDAVASGWEYIPTWKELGANCEACLWPMAADGRVGWTNELDDPYEAGQQHFGYLFGDAAATYPYVIRIRSDWWLSFVPPCSGDVNADTYMLAGRSELEARLTIHRLQQLGRTHAP